MTIAETLTQKVIQLPLSRQLEVLNFVEFLEHKQGQVSPRHDPEGLLADRPSDLSPEDLAEARKQAWSNFPRELQ